LNRPAAQNLRSLALLKLRRFDESLAANQVALRLDPSNPNYIFNTGLIYLAKGDLNSAEAVLRKAAAGAPGSSRLQEGLGETYFAMARYPDAERCFRRAVELDQLSITAQIGLTKLFYSVGNRAEFAAAAKRALSMAPENPLACYYYGKYLLDEPGQVAEGRKYIEKSCILAPAFTEGLIAWGNILRQERRWEEAARVYEQARRVEPSNPQIYYLLSLAYGRAGRTDKADWALHEFQSLQKK
jgi:tetratricopeptide (TPR) repeat protein